MIYKNRFEDFFFETTASTLDYMISTGGQVIFQGRAVKSPANPVLRINVGQRVRDYLENEMPDFRDFDGVVVPHPDALLDFELQDVFGNPLETYRVLLDYTEDFTGADMILSDPVNGHTDPRQKIFWASFNTTERDIELLEYKRIEMSFAGGTGATTVNACDEAVVSTNVGWISATYSGNTVIYNVSANEFDNERSGFIYVLCSGVVICVIEIAQTIEASLGITAFAFNDTGADHTGHTLDRTIIEKPWWHNPQYECCAIPQSGRTAEPTYLTYVPVINITLKRNGVEYATERIFPTVYKEGAGKRNINTYYFTVGENTGSTKVEYEVIFKDLAGTWLGTIFSVQPPAVPPEYEARNVLSGTNLFEYYTTNGNAKFGDADGVYFATDEEAAQEGYPLHGGYPDTPVKRFVEWPLLSDFRDKCINYLQSTATGFTFPNADLIGLSAPNMEYIDLITFKNFFSSTVSGAKRVCDVLDVPRVLAIAGSTFTGWESNKYVINDINLYSVSIIDPEVFYWSYSGQTNIYLPNICYVSYNNFRYTLGITDVWLGNGLRVIGRYTYLNRYYIYDLPSNIRFHYMGTKAEFLEKVVYCPNGTYYCTDGELTIDKGEHELTS